MLFLNGFIHMYFTCHDVMVFVSKDLSMNLTCPYCDSRRAMRRRVGERAGCMIGGVGGAVGGATAALEAPPLVLL